MALTFAEGFELYAGDSFLSTDREHPLESLLRDFSYKPGWEFSTSNRMGRTYLLIRFKAVDADAPQSECILRFEYSISNAMVSGRDEKYWMRWLRERIIECEKHEVDEFFQIKGIKVFDPH